jgi:hypothetical protein
LSIASGSIYNYSVLKSSDFIYYFPNQYSNSAKSILPPISFSCEYAKDFIEFIECYVRNSLDLDKDFFPLWRLAVEADGSPINTSCLTLTTSIEGVIMSLYKDEASLSSEKNEELDSSLDIIKNNTELTEKMKQRICGSIKRWKSTASAKDILNYLKENQVIAKQHVISWEALRHRSAHGILFSWENTNDLQKIKDNYSTSIHLMYIILLHYIEYGGKHYNYSKSGHPIEDFTRGEIL